MTDTTKPATAEPWAWHVEYPAGAASYVHVKACELDAIELKRKYPDVVVTPLYPRAATPAATDEREQFDAPRYAHEAFEKWWDDEGSAAISLEKARRAFAAGAASLTLRLQQRCTDWGTYWRASDAHGVHLSHEQALDLLRDVLGVEVEVASPGDALAQAVLDLNKGWNAKETESLIAQRIDLARRLALQVQAARAQLAAPPTVPEAMAVVTQAMRDDPEYAWGWHCNIAMAYVDAGGDHAIGNHGAARFLRSLANVEPAHELPTKAAEAGRDALDAARYRFLRSTLKTPDTFLVKHTSDGSYWMSREGMDAAIDAQIAALAGTPGAPRGQQ